MTSEEIRAVAEEVADVLEERGLVAAPAAGPARVLDTVEVAEQLGRDRGWVYDHATELGAFRMGTGPKARLGFDQHAIDAWKREQSLAGAPSTTSPARRSPGRRGSSSPDLIPSHGPTRHHQLRRLRPPARRHARGPARATVLPVLW